MIRYCVLFCLEAVIMVMARTFFCLLGLTTLLAGCTQVSINGELKPSRIYEFGKPATILIQTDYRAEVQVPEVILNQYEMQMLGERAASAIEQGNLPNDQTIVTREIAKEMLNNWRKYLIPGSNMRPILATMSGVGSGFFVTSEGHVVTNAHVVVPIDAELRQGLVNNALDQLIQEDVKEFAGAMGTAATPEMIEQLKKVAVEFYVENMKLGELERRIQVIYGAGSKGTEPKVLDAEIVEKGTGTPIPGKDVALLKVSGSNFLSLPIGEDENLKTGDRMLVVGFPAAATFMPEFKAESITESTLTTGVLSRKVKMKDGWEVLQTDAAVSGGNSGGPAFNEKGEVIGIATFVSIDPETGKPVEGLHFVVPSKIVLEKLKEAGVEPKFDEIAKLYRTAIAKMEQNYFKPAIKDLEQLKKTVDNSGWIDEQIATCEKAISEGKDESVKANLFIYIGIGVCLVVFAILIWRNAARNRASSALTGSNDLNP